MKNSNYVVEYKVGDDGAKNHGWVSASRDFSDIKKFYPAQADAEKNADELRWGSNVSVRVRRTSDDKIVSEQSAPNKPRP